MELLGFHGTVEYGDQHDSFDRMLPRSGVITRQIELAGSDLPRYVFTLHEPFEWEKHHVEHFIIAARWLDHPIGGPDFTSLFVLLDPQHCVATGDRFAWTNLFRFAGLNLYAHRQRPNHAMEQTADRCTLHF